MSRKDLKGTSNPVTVYEKAVKQAVLDSKVFFSEMGDLGKTRVVFEKACGYGELIADCLIFTENKGIIGIEIKTAHDTLKRLSHQLDSYVKVCNYTYVFCHDSQLAGVQELLKSKGLVNTVGIISYVEFEDDVVGGVVKQANYSKYYNLHYALEMLWKSQIYRILQMYLNRPEQVAVNTYGGISSTHSKVGSNLTRQTVSRKLNKKQLINMYVNFFGVDAGTKILVRQFQVVQPYPDRVLKLYKFKDD